MGTGVLSGKLGNTGGGKGEITLFSLKYYKATT